MKCYPNNCQKCYEVVKLYGVRLFLLLELGEFGRVSREDNRLLPPLEIEKQFFICIALMCYISCISHTDYKYLLFNIIG